MKISEGFDVIACDGFDVDKTCSAAVGCYWKKKINKCIKGKGKNE